MSTRKTYVVDIDNTLIKSEKKCCTLCGNMIYSDWQPIRAAVDKVNRWYEEGARIILWTGRNWDRYELTKEHLRNAGVKYHELVMGKPQGDYVDVDAITTLEGE